MKKIWFGILAFLVGELVAIAHKDKLFKKNLQKKTGMEKWKYIFHSLFDFNKQLVQSVPAVDKEAIKTRAQEEYTHMVEKAKLLEDHLEKWSEEKLQPHLTELESLYATYKEKAKEYSDQLDLEEKLHMIKTKIDHLKKKLKA